MTEPATSQDRRRWASALLVLCLLGAACASPEPEASQIATDACTLAEELMAGDIGFTAAAMRGQRLLRDARNADTSLDEVLAEARTICPDVVDALPFEEGEELPSLNELRERFGELQDQAGTGGGSGGDGVSELDLDGLDLDGLDLDGLDLDQLDLDALGDLDLDALDLDALDLDAIDLERIRRFLESR